MIQLGRRVLLLVSLASLLVIALWLWLSWNHARQAQLQRMSVATTLIAAHADHYFASMGTRMELLVLDLQRADVLRSPPAARPLLERFKASNPDVGGATLILPSGQMLASTAHRPGEPLPNVLSDPAWREDFEHNLTMRGLSINRPQFGYLLKQWLIHLRYTVRDRQGKVLYLVQTSIPLEKQQVLWRNLPLAADAAVGLLRTDGYLISRLPQDPSGQIYHKKNSGGALYLATHRQPAGGYYEGITADGVYRLGAHQRLANYPLHAFLSFPRATFVAIWWQQVQWPVYLVTLALTVSLLTYGLLARRFAGRMRAIEERLRRHVSTTPPSSGVQEIDTLVLALAETQNQLRVAAHNRERLLLAAAEAGTYVVRERDNTILAADRAFLGMLALTEAEVLGRPWTQLLADPDDAGTAVAEGPELTHRVLRFRHRDGTPRGISVAEFREHAADGEQVRHGLGIDVSDRERLLNAVRTQSGRLQALWQLATSRDKAEDEKIALMLRLALDSLAMDVAWVSELGRDKLTVRHLADRLNLFHANQEFALSDVLCRLTVATESTQAVPDLRADPECRDHPLVTEMGIRTYASVPVWVGTGLYGTMVFLRRTPLAGGLGGDDQAFMELLAAWFGQMLWQQHSHAELERLALTDSLTQIANRRAAEQRFAEEFARARRGAEVFSIALCDLDRFKLINDLYGHDTGDDVLLHIVAVMKAQLREGDWMARWGGEEFIVFLHQSDAASSYAAMERLRQAVRAQPVATRYGPIEITVSIGIGTLREGVDLDGVVSEADGCLYEAKKSGRDCVMISETSRRGTLWRAGMLQQALRENRVVPAYQVIVDLATREVVADEALARLVEPDGRTIIAGEFIEAAEGIHLIHAVDQVIARQSLQRCVNRIVARRDGPHTAHFINLSPQFLARRELVAALLHDAERYCAECHIEFGAIKPVVFEITERQLIGNMEDLKRDLQPLLDFGFRLALDDFGSGYSSFLYLASLPISFLKIEGWMVRHMRTNPKVMNMVQSIVQMAHKQGIKTVAESVEDAETAERLRAMGVHWAQGNYFGAPECEAVAAPPACCPAPAAEARGSPG